MPRAVIDLRQLLAAVARECTIPAVLEALPVECHYATVWRALGRAEALGQVEHTRACDGVDVWELTTAGRRVLGGDGDRPACPECSSASGSRLELDREALDTRHRLVPRLQLVCRACGHRWHSTAFERELAEARDRKMSAQGDVFAAAQARYEQARRQR